jgi:hypothetical protein
MRSGGIGSLFHYAHFLIDCLFPEVVNRCFNYEVVRKKTIQQTLGNLSKIYVDVMQTKNIELLPAEFNELSVPLLVYKNRNTYSPDDFSFFKTFVYNRYNVQADDTYPKIILIKRGGRIKLIDDPHLKRLNKNVTTGKERREIHRIDDLEVYLSSKYGNTFKGLYLETMTFEEQVKHFRNAKMIIGAHGAGMFNAFFCTEGALLFEVTCGWKSTFLDTISKMNKLVHVKCTNNNYDTIVSHLNSLPNV